MEKNDHEEERQKGWILILESYFRDLEKKAAFLQKLSDEGHEDEALTLCCCYIDGLANGVYGREEGSNKNFIRALREFGENEIWGLIHPLQFVRNVLEIAQKKNQSKLKGIIEKIIPLLATLKNSLYMESEILETVKSVLSQEEVTRLKKNLWRGLFANIAYEEIRCFAIHDLGAVSLSFDKTKYKGEQLPHLNFHTLYPILLRVLYEAKTRTLRTGKLWGYKDDTIKWPFMWPENVETRGKEINHVQERDRSMNLGRWSVKKE